MIQFFGAVLLVAGCGGFGYALAASHRRETKLLRQLIHGVQEMEWELKYRNTALPDLCRVGAEGAGGGLRPILRELGEKLDRNEAVEISGCLNAIVLRHDLPRSVRRNLKQLGRSLGRYDLEGQLEGLQLVRRQCRKELQALEEGSSQRLRNYQTLALCGGLALAILLV